MEQKQYKAALQNWVLVRKDLDQFFEHVMVMDPMRLTDGIEPSDDPILHVRPGAYSVSVERRIQAA